MGCICTSCFTNDMCAVEASAIFKYVKSTSVSCKSFWHISFSLLYMCEDAYYYEFFKQIAS